MPIMHREEDRVNTDETQPEMNLAERFVHHTPEHFRIPEIDRSENGEDRSSEEHVMNMSDDKIRIVNKNIDRRRSHENSG